MKFVKAALITVFILSTVVALNLGWAFYFGECADGCAGGMAFIFFLPSVIVSALTGLGLMTIWLRGRRARNEQQDHLEQP